MSLFRLAHRSDEGFKTKRIPFFTTKNRVRGGPEAGKAHSECWERQVSWEAAGICSLAGGEAELIPLQFKVQLHFVKRKYV